VPGVPQGVPGRLTTLSFLVLVPGSPALFSLWLLLASLATWRLAGAARTQAPRAGQEGS
jgi:hypothetical protein